MGYVLQFKGAIPSSLAPTQYDLDGDGRKDVMPTPQVPLRLGEPLRLASYGALQCGSERLPLQAPPPGVARHPLFPNDAHYVACMHSNAWFHHPNPKSHLVFSPGLRVGLLDGTGKIHTPMVISGFLIGLNRGPILMPVMNSQGRVMAQAVRVEGGKATQQNLIEDLVWVIGHDERVNPDWVLKSPPRIPQTRAEQLLRPLFEDIQAKSVLPAESPDQRQQRIDFAITKWAKMARSPNDQARVAALSTPLMRAALTRSLGLLRD